MQQSKLITILKSLNPTEFRQFYRYLQAPLLTQSKDVLTLYNVVRKHYPTFDSPKLDRQKVFKKLYPKKPFDGNRFSILLFKLTAIIDEYLIFLKYQQDEFQKKKLLTQIYGERNLNVIFKKNTEKLLEELEEQHIQDGDTFYEKYYLLRQSFLHINTPNRHKLGNELIETLNNLENFHTLEHLFLSIVFKNRKERFSEKHEFTPNISRKKLSNNPVYLLYAKSYDFFENKSYASFLELKNFYKNHLSKFRKLDQIVFNILLRNFSIQLKETANDPLFLKVHFELCKLAVDNQLIYEGNEISGGIFINISLIAVKNKEFVWAENFILKYSKDLSDLGSKNVRELALGHLQFYQRKYKEVIDMLSSRKFKSANHERFAKSLLLGAYYKIFEEDESYFSLLKAKVASFQKFLKRNESIKVKWKKTDLHFCKIIEKIAMEDLNKSWNPNKKKDYLAVIHGHKNITLKSWLIEIIESK